MLRCRGQSEGAELKDREVGRTLHRKGKGLGFSCQRKTQGFEEKRNYFESGARRSKGKLGNQLRGSGNKVIFLSDFEDGSCCVFCCCFWMYGLK